MSSIFNANGNKVRKVPADKHIVITSHDGGTDISIEKDKTVLFSLKFGKDYANIPAAKHAAIAKAMTKVLLSRALQSDVELRKDVRIGKLYNSAGDLVESVENARRAITIKRHRKITRELTFDIRTRKTVEEKWSGAVKGFASPFQPRSFKAFIRYVIAVVNAAGK